MNCKDAESGFSLLEALIAVALMALLCAMLATVTAQWMRGWKAGFDRTQNDDLLGLGLDRIVADIGAAEFISPGQAGSPISPGQAGSPISPGQPGSHPISPGQAGSHPIFQGTDSSVTFVRSAIGPNSPAGLEIVRLAEIDDARGRILVRTRTAFTPSVTAGAIDDGTIEFTNPVVLIRPPFRVSFAFAGPDRVWREGWLNASKLPEAVRVTVRDGQTDEILPVSTAALVNITAPAECAANATRDCGGRQNAGQRSGAPSGDNAGANAPGGGG